MSPVRCIFGLPTRKTAFANYTHTPVEKGLDKMIVRFLGHSMLIVSSVQFLERTTLVQHLMMEHSLMPGYNHGACVFIDKRRPDRDKAGEFFKNCPIASCSQNAILASGGKIKFNLGIPDIGG